MDRQQTIGFILITFILIFWMWYVAPKPQDIKTQKTEVAPQTENKIAENPTTEAKKEEPPSAFFQSQTIKAEEIITIETDLYVAQISTNGGVLKKWQLKKYNLWNKKEKVDLIDQSLGGDLNLLFTSKDGKIINTKTHQFNFVKKLPARITLKENESYKIDLSLPSANGEIIKSFTFKNNEYVFDFDVELKNMNDVVANYEYQVEWENGLLYSERNSYDESSVAKSFVYSGGELTELDVANIGENLEISPNGNTDWVATRTKYFALAIIPQDKKATSAFLSGKHYEAKPMGSVEKYTIALTFPFKGEQNHKTNFKIFLGPLEYSLIKKLNYNLEEIMTLGWSWIRPITVYIFIPLFNFLHGFISNYGILIIIFTLVLKILMFPLTRSTTKSMQKMQALAPMVEEIKQKYKEDQSQANIQVMKLYRDYGANPAGGCLPLLLQMPILSALYSLFSNAIELRQSNFVFWMSDLSVPDVIFSLPFKIPLLGLQDFSGLALAMGVTMFLQQKMTITDPRQKALVWMMPVMMTLLFNNFPAGLNLYYFAFNIFAISEQIYYKNKKMKEPLKKVEKKGKSSWFEGVQRKLEESQKSQKKK